MTAKLDGIPNLLLKTSASRKNIPDRVFARLLIVDHNGEKNWNILKRLNAKWLYESLMNFLTKRWVNMAQQNSDTSIAKTVTYRENSLKTIIFILPLPNSIRVPDGYNVSFEEPDTQSDVGSIQFINEQGISLRIKERILFRKAETSLDCRPYELTESLSRELNRNSKKKNLKKNKNEIKGYATVAYASIIVERKEYEESDYTQFFNQVLSTLRSYMKSYYVVDRQPIELPSRMNLPAIITIHEEDINPDGSLILNENSNIRQSALMINGSFDPFILTEKDIDIEVLEAAVHPDITLGSEVINATLDTYREASLAYRRGETIAASILFASSVEIFLDTLFLYLLWEEGQRPENANILLYETKMCECKDCKSKMTTTLDRVNRGEFADRIGGDWSKNSDLMTSWREVAELRNEVVHTGIQPDISQLDPYLVNIPKIQTTLTDYLVSAIDKYPITAYFFAGQDGLERRGMSSNLNDYIPTDDFKPSSLSLNYLNWKREVDRLSSKKLRKTKDEVCQLAYVIHQDGHNRWILYDGHLKLFRLINEQNIGKNTAIQLKTIETKVRKTKGSQTIIVDVKDVVPKIKTSKTIWHPMYLLSSSLDPIDRWPTSYTMPSE